MNTRQRQGFWRLGRGAFGLQVAMLVLVMLTAGISPAWAGETWDKTGTDDGGGTYRYRGEGDDIETDYWKPGDNGYFKTTQFFDSG